jgi:hypothetical protein
LDRPRLPPEFEIARLAVNLANRRTVRSNRSILRVCVDRFGRSVGLVDAPIAAVAGSLAGWFAWCVCVERGVGAMLAMLKTELEASNEVAHQDLVS